MARFDGAAEHRLGAARNADFVDTVTIEGVDWSNSTFSAALRLYPDAPGSPMIAMTITTPVFDGQDTHFTRSIPKAFLTSLPFPEAGNDLKLRFDMTRTEGGVTTVVDCGEFILHGRITV